MTNDKKPAETATKREWSAPKVTRRAQMDRTQGGTTSLFPNEGGFYYTPS